MAQIRMEMQYLSFDSFVKSFISLYVLFIFILLSSHISLTKEQGNDPNVRVFTVVGREQHLRLYLQDQKSKLYGKYEYYEPNLICHHAISSNVNGCYEEDPNNFILCCLFGRRGTGTFCLKENKTNSYDQFEFDSYEFIFKEILQYNTQETIVQMNNVTNYLKNPDLYDEFQNFLQSVIIDQKSYTVLRPSFLDTINDNQNSNGNSSSTGSQDKEEDLYQWFLVSKSSNYFTNYQTYKNSASCEGEHHDSTRTHQYSEHINDQFYDAKNRISLAVQIPEIFPKKLYDLVKNISFRKREQQYYIEMELDFQFKD